MVYFRKTVLILAISFVFFQGVQYVVRTFSVIAALCLVLMMLLSFVAWTTYMVWREKEKEIQKASGEFGRAWAIKSCYPMNVSGTVLISMFFWSIAELVWYVVGWAITTGLRIWGI